METSLNKYIENAIKNNWDSPALSDYNGGMMLYRDVAKKIAQLHLLFENSGILPGDKIAICGKNSSQWAIALLATLTYGAVGVPILHEFKADTLHNLINHSNAKLLFADNATWGAIDPELVGNLEGAIFINDFSIMLSRNPALDKAWDEMKENFEKKYPDGLGEEQVQYHCESKEEVALINYTSGSTGFSKGVMITYGNLWSNVQFSIDKLTFLLPGDQMLSMLPLAHMYGLLVELLHPLVKGCHIYFLTLTPSPRIIMEAFATVKPKLIIAVPLILEKIIKNYVFPVLEKPAMKLLRKTPLIGGCLYRAIKKKLIKTFGGNLQQIIIGGASLNEEVEKLLRRIRFPYTVGYGMTECAPLIAYCPWEDLRPGSCGRLVDRMEMRIESPDPVNTPGELWLKGDNVMAGYYKNPEATESAFRQGWMATGDICNIDADGFIYIRGRNKTMILGPSGQNIYPEEIELKLSNKPLVNESVVIEEEGKIVALIHPDMEAAKAAGMTIEQIQALMEENVKQVNQELPGYSRISRTKVHEQEFEKTPKRSIKRYIYQHK